MSRNLPFVCLLGLGITTSAGVQATQLTAPSNTSAIAISESRIDVRWRDNSRNESGFEIYRASGTSGVFTLIGTAPAGATAAGDPGLNPSTDYCYKVRAVAKVGGKPQYSAFSIPACATTPAPPAQPGTIHIATATSGFDLDVDGYRVRVDNAPDQALGTNAAVTIAGLSAGAHSVGLSSLASNCSVEGTNPRAVSVVGGTTIEIAFVVTCGPGPAIQLNTLTTGESIDADGYGVMVWQRATGSRILAGSAGVPANGAVRFFGLTTGQYDVEINGIAANCMQINVLPMAELTSGGTESLALNVACAPIVVPAEICDNGIDDDGDGLIDGADPDCGGGGGCWYDCSFDHCPAGFICGYDGCCVSHCNDGQRNADEGDVDCGGSCGTKCQRGQTCGLNYDCASNFCYYSICQ